MRRLPGLVAAGLLLAACGDSGSLRTDGSRGAGEPNDTLASATPVALDAKVQASFDSPYDVDVYVFTVPDGGRDVRFQTFDGTGGGCAGVDPYLEFYSATGEFMAWDDDGAAMGSCEDLTLTLPAGTYYVVVGTNPGLALSPYVLGTSTAPMSARTARTLTCTFTDVCDEVGGPMTDAQLSDVAASCASAGGAYSLVSPCSTAGAISGHCRYASTSLTGVWIAGGTVDEHYYAVGGWTLSSAQSYCAEPPAGTWVP